MSIREQIESIIRDALVGYMRSSSAMIGYFIPAHEITGLVRTITNNFCDEIVFPELDFERVITDALLSPQAQRTASKQDLARVIAEDIKNFMKGKK